MCISPSGLEHSKKYPPPEEYVKAKRKQWEEDEKSLTSDPDYHGSLGCICIDRPPMFVGTFKTLQLDGADNDAAHLLAGFNAARILWPIVADISNNGTTTETTVTARTTI